MSCGIMNGLFDLRSKELLPFSPGCCPLGRKPLLLSCKTLPRVNVMDDVGGTLTSGSEGLRTMILMSTNHLWESIVALFGLITRSVRLCQNSHRIERRHFVELLRNLVGLS